MRHVTPNSTRSMAAALALAVLVGGCTACLEAGTLIATPQGDRAIETLQVGDTVWAWNLAQGQPVARRVAAIAHHVRWRVPRLAVAGGAPLAVTAEHPVFVVGEGFVPAALVRPGATLLAWRGGAPQTMKAGGVFGRRRAVAARAGVRPCAGRVGTLLPGGRRYWKSLATTTGHEGQF